MIKNSRHKLKVICYIIIKRVVLLINLLVPAEKPCCYPHDDVTARKLISFWFLQQTGGKTFHIGSHLLMCWSRMFLNIFSQLNNISEIWKTFSHCIVLIVCLFLYEAAHFMTFKQIFNSKKYLKVIKFFCVFHDI